MEADENRLYSVLTRTEIRKKMDEEINNISEVFLLSSSTVTLILVYLRWNSDKANVRLSDEKEQLMAELGLLDLNENESNSSSADLEITDDLVSTPFCTHKFCTTFWTDYLNEILQKNKEKKVIISCPNKDCVAPVGLDTIEKLPKEVQEMYDDYTLGSYMESNKKSIKWCPAPGCNYAIEREGFQLDMVCLCGHIFCWTCEQESHRPVTCKNASLWLNSLMDQARTLHWISTNIKPCPDCNTPVERNDDPKHTFVTCDCRYKFCWDCLSSKKEHKKKLNCYEVSVPQPEHEFNLTHNLILWDATDEAMELAKFYLKNSIPKLIKDCGLIEEEIKAIKEAWMLIVQCRLVLKWSYVFDYFINDYQIVKKPYLDYLRDQALTILYKYEETLNELMKQAKSGGDITLLKHRLETKTRTTGNYFAGFVKTLEDALSEVKTDASENEIISDWFCDRCTSQNSLSAKACHECLTPLRFPHHLEFGFKNIAIADPSTSPKHAQLVIEE